MLTLTIASRELFDDNTQMFVDEGEPVQIQLEHSLDSMSKWESQWEIPFLDTQKKTEEQVLDYVRHMIVGPEPAPEVFSRLVEQCLDEVNTYINAKMSATWVNESNAANGQQEIITSELIYYWMISLGIPFECQHWHLNKLLMLIKVCNVKNSPKKKMSFNERATQQRDLNAERRAKYGSKG